MIAPVDSIGNGGHLGCVADDPDKGRGVVQLLHHVGAGTLTQGTNNALAGDPRLSRDDDMQGDSNSIVNQELLYRGWFHHLLYMTAVHLWQNGTLQSIERR